MALATPVLHADRPLWTAGERALPLRCAVQIRAHGEVHDGVVHADGERWEVHLDEPAVGVAPGQAAVLYDDDVVLGSATLAGPG